MLYLLTLHSIIALTAISYLCCPWPTFTLYCGGVRRHCLAMIDSGALRCCDPLPAFSCVSLGRSLTQSVQFLRLESDLRTGGDS